MAEPIKIQLDDIYRPITEEQIRSAKSYVLRRESTARGIASLVDALLADAAEKIVQICYRYNVDPRTFQISARFNEDMFKEVAAVLDELEDDILDLLADYCTRCTKDKKKRSNLLLWVLTLGKGGKALKATVEDRIKMFVKDIEAMIVAAKVAKFDLTKAITLIKSHLFNAYQMPGMQQAFKNASLFNAQYIRCRGVKKGNIGSSNSEANNIDRMVKTTVQMAWMRYIGKEYEEQNAAGFMCLRGSTYPCSICDDVCYKFYPINSKMPLPVHPNCQCYAIPIFEKDINELTE